MRLSKHTINKPGFSRDQGNLSNTFLSIIHTVFRCMTKVQFIIAIEAILCYTT